MFIYGAGESVSFSSDLAKFAKKTNINIEKALRITATSVFSSVVLRTPIKSGRARANWLYTMDSPATGTVTDVNVKPIKAGRGHTHILTNNLPYIDKLENGNSTQAPNGMLKVTVTEFENHLKKAVRDL